MDKRHCDFASVRAYPLLQFTSGLRLALINEISRVVMGWGVLRLVSGGRSAGTKGRGKKEGRRSKGAAAVKGSQSVYKTDRQVHTHVHLHATLVGV